jgi:hypothetical protein
MSKEEEAGKYASQLRTLYSGSSTNKAEYNAILAGRTNVVEDMNSDFEARSDTVDGIKTITLGSKAFSTGGTFDLNVIFSHESYRNGLDDGEDGQRLERDNAVIGHNKTASDIISTYGSGALSTKLIAENFIFNELAKYDNQDGIQALLDTYDSSADYWRVLKDANGNVTKVLDDGDRKHATIVDADGTEHIIELQGGSVSAALAAAVGNGMTKKEMNDTMVRSNLGFNEETKLWFAKDNSAIYIKPAETVQDTSIASVFDSAVQSGKKLTNDVGNSISSFFKGVGNSIDKAGKTLKNLFTEKEEEPKKVGNKFSINDKNNQTIDLLKVDTDNAVLAQLLQQTDTALSSNSAISPTGCNFMTVLGFTQMITGQTLTSAQILEVFNEALKGDAILYSNAYVNNPDKLSDIALSKLGRTDIGFNYGWNPNGGTLAGYRVKQGDPADSLHFLMGNLNADIIYNPASKVTKPFIENTGVYVYAK